MDGARDAFWINSLNSTFLALQIKSFGPKKFPISSTGKKVPFCQFFRMGWDGRALLGQPSRIPHRNLKNSFVLGADALESAYAFMLTHSKIQCNSVFKSVGQILLIIDHLLIPDCY